MTERRTRMRLPGPGAAVLAALALAGCAGTHVGDAWQCPLAQGSVCASVAAADPAVPAKADPGRLAATGPLWRPQDDGAGPAADAAPGGEPPSGCDAGCNPMDWLAGLFAVGGDGIDETALPGPRERAPDVVPPSQAPMAQAATDETGAQAASPVENGDSAADALRAPETIGRVWIAPFVDEDGVYREASWVRIVIAPAAWRLR